MAQDIRFPSIDGLRAFEASARLVALARPWLAAGSLVPVLPQRAWPTQHYQLIGHTGSDAAKHFERWLRAVCEHELAEAQEELSRRL